MLRAQLGYVPAIPGGSPLDPRVLEWQWQSWRGSAPSRGEVCLVDFAIDIRGDLCHLAFGLGAITCGIQTGCTVERVHFQARVVGEGDKSAGLGEGNRFFGCVLCVGVSIFDHIKIKVDLRGRNEFNPCIFEQVLQFFYFPFVIGGDEERSCSLFSIWRVATALILFYCPFCMFTHHRFFIVQCIL